MPMVKQRVGPYKRTIKGKVYKVKPHLRRKRRQGKKVTYKKIGTFYAAFDKYGNLKGSRVVKKK